jgi:hypothetical protein
MSRTFRSSQNLRNLGKKSSGRHDRAAPALNGFEDKTGDGANRGLVEVLAVEFDVLVGVDRPVRLGPHRAVGIRARHHVRTGGAHGTVHVGSDVAKRDGAVRLPVKVVEAADGLVPARGGAEDADAGLDCGGT